MVGEFSILIAIVILGGALIKILADMRSNADRQIKVAEEILKAVRARSSVRTYTDPIFDDMSFALSRIKDHTDGLRMDVGGIETAVKDMKEELKTAIRVAAIP
jgi:hypothetical protein